MLAGVVFRRLWRERRRMGVLLLALCLVTGFLALAPLYVRAVSGSELERRLENTTRRDTGGEFRNIGPIAADMRAVLDDRLGDKYAGDVEVYNFTVNEYDMGLLIAQASAYQEYDSLFTLVEGRQPVMREDGIIEVTVTQAVQQMVRNGNANLADFGVGTRLPVGEFNTLGEIVGIVEPRYQADDVRWSNLQRAQVFGVVRPNPPGADTYFFSPLTTEAIFEQGILSTTDALYLWQFQVQTDAITIDNLDAFEADLRAVGAHLRDRHPESEFRTPLFAIIDDFQGDIQQVGQSVLLLSALVLTLMLYNVVTTISLILEQQSQEWATIASRGGSIGQLIGIHAASMAVLGLLAALIGPLLAQGILLILSAVGPQAAILERQHVLGLTADAFMLSSAAALVAVILLTLPAYALVRRGLLTLKRNNSRPPTNPVWARFFLDIVLLVLGAAFILRLYAIASGERMSDLLRDPATLVDAIAGNATLGLDDPFNLLGPALLLTGAALLWMRVFPLLMTLFGTLLGGVNDLTSRMALWNVERDPGHYAQLVLLIIGTLALGTASLSLIETRNAGASEVATQETGGDVRIALDAHDADPLTNWVGLPGTVSGVPLVVAEFANTLGGDTIVLFGVNTALMAAAFPQLGDAMAQLDAAPAPDLPGMPIPAGTMQIRVDAYTEGEDDATLRAGLALQLLGADQVQREILMTTDDPTVTDAFITYTALLPEAAGADWQLMGFRFVHERLIDGQPQNVEIVPTLYLDNLRTVGADGATVLLNAFEPATYDRWGWNGRYRTSGTILTNEDRLFTEGEHSLRVTYRSNRGSSSLPILEYDVGEVPSMPALISPAFAQRFGLRSPLARVLEPGDTLNSQLRFAGLNSYDIRYMVLDLQREFPTQAEGAVYLVTRADWLQTQLNFYINSGIIFGVNEVWLDLETTEPTAAQIAAFEALPGFSEATYAWTRVQEIQRDPLANGVTGMLFAGFWVSLGLILLDFAFYMAVTTEKRATSMAVLRSIGWDRQNIWRMLTVEQAAFITPALFVGLGLGALVAYLILPFLGLVGGVVLQIPLVQVALLLVVLIVAFTLLLAVTAVFLQRMDVNRAMRTVE